MSDLLEMGSIHSKFANATANSMAEKLAHRCLSNIRGETSSNVPGCGFAIVCSGFGTDPVEESIQGVERRSGGIEQSGSRAMKPWNDTISIAIKC